MSTIAPKSKKTAAKTLVDEPTIDKALNKKTAKKSAIVIASEATESKEVVKKVIESEVTAFNKKRKTVKAKVIRDSFSFPEQDYVKISELKKTCLAAGIHAKKNEILRAGLLLLTKLNLTELIQVVEQVEKVQTGRPKSSKS